MEAGRLLEAHGLNELPHQRKTNPLRLLGAQLKSPLVLLLLVATVVSAFLGDITEAIAIAAIVLINALVGFVQEFRAERSVAAMRSLTARRARVLRAGRLETIAANQVVPGDVLILDAGDLVAADARLIEANALSTVEAALTGESDPVEKGCRAPLHRSRDGRARGSRLHGHSRGLGYRASRRRVDRVSD